MRAPAALRGVSHAGGAAGPGTGAWFSSLSRPNASAMRRRTPQTSQWTSTSAASPDAPNSNSLSR